MSRTTIDRVTITPVAFRDPPLLSTFGVHEPYALRSIIELETSDGRIGIGETYGDAEQVELLEAVRADIMGIDVFALGPLRTAIERRLAGARYVDWTGIEGDGTNEGTVDRVFAGFEVACLDLQGQIAGRPVSDLLGGAVRTAVPYSAYLFYKWAGHPGMPADTWGPALDAEGIVQQARRLVGRHGFRSVKLKGGALPPDEEAEAIVALHRELPGVPLRLDPNGAWSVPTAIRIARRLAGMLEYLEDPTLGHDGMAEVGRSVSVPLATNMIVVSPDQLPEAILKRSIAIVLLDHHLWGGLRRCRSMADLCAAFGIGLSMHSNSHLGISLAAMTHLAAATPNLTFACDTHRPWNFDEDVITRPLAFVDGAVTVPAGPGLGVELDREALGRLHEQYLACGVRSRNDTAYRRRFEPSFEAVSPRW